MAATRQAIMRVSRELMLLLLPESCVLRSTGEVVIEEGIGRKVDYSWLEKLLHLPASVKITGVSTHAFFCYDQVLIRIESPDFVETQEGCVLPEVEALYASKDGKPLFLGWRAGAAVIAGREVHWAAEAQAVPEAWEKQFAELNPPTGERGNESLPSNPDARPERSPLANEAAMPAEPEGGYRSIRFREFF